MDYKKLANLLFPNISKTIEDYEKIYPERKLDNNCEVCRFAPSPTGRMHMGNLFASFIPEVFSHQSNGIFILRIEDTDNKRAIDDGIKLILNDLKSYNYKIDENPIDGGKYAPYIQSERKEIYSVFAKYLVSIGRAYPCFCSEDGLNSIRDNQINNKDRIGYYGKFAKCRDLTYNEIEKKINNKEKYVIRLKSLGDFNKKIIFKDKVKGIIELPENDIDHVLLKSDGVPPYAFAHVVDDHLMRITTVTRDDSYISSIPYHLEIWESFGFKIPKFAHLLPLCKKEDNKIRKISKRKDPEAAVRFYEEKGIPTEAIKLYFATLLNSNFEGWYQQNPTLSYTDFKFTFDKMSKSGMLFDLDKLNNISKNYISRLSAKEVYNNFLIWSKEFDLDFYNLINKYENYTINILNIEREQKKPRKDYSCYSEIKNNIWYMYDELYNNIDYSKIEIKHFFDKSILLDYINNYFNIEDDKDTWYNKIKQLGNNYNFADEVKVYKDNPNLYRGHVGDICELIRISVTSKTMTPDLYEIMKLLGKEKIKKRIQSFIDTL